MKKIALGLVLVVAGLLAYNYAVTGKVSLLPVKVSAEERELAELADQLRDAVRQAGQASRAASMGGADTTSDLEAARHSVREVETALAKLGERFDSESARQLAARLRAEVREFRKRFG